MSRCKFNWNAREVRCGTTNRNSASPNAFHPVPCGTKLASSRAILPVSTRAFTALPQAARQQRVTAPQMDAAAGCVRLPYSQRMDGSAVVMPISGCTPAHHSRQFATSVASGFLHGLENIRDRAHLAWGRAITQIGSIRIFVVGVIAVHAHWHP